MKRAGSETLIRTDLEHSKEIIKSEIRRQLKLKEGAENLKKVATDKRSLSQCSAILKESSAKLQDLHQQLQDLNALVNEDPICKYYRSFLSLLRSVVNVLLFPNVQVVPVNMDTQVLIATAILKVVSKKTLCTSTKSLYLYCLFLIRLKSRSR
jgi:hypothetical protein